MQNIRGSKKRAIKLGTVCHEGFDQNRKGKTWKRRVLDLWGYGSSQAGIRSSALPMSSPHIPLQSTPYLGTGLAANVTFATRLGLMNSGGSGFVMAIFSDLHKPFNPIASRQVFGLEAKCQSILNVVGRFIQFLPGQMLIPETGRFDHQDGPERYS